MSKKKAFKSKSARGVRNLPAKTLSAKRARGVKGGARAGKDKLGYMLVKLNDVIITCA